MENSIERRPHGKKLCLIGLLKIVIINRLGLVRLTFTNLEAFPFCFLSKRSFVFGVDEDNQNLLVGL